MRCVHCSTVSGCDLTAGSETMDDMISRLTQALETLDLRELTGDPKITAEEAAYLIDDGIRNRNLWDREYEIWQSLLDGAVALAEAHGWVTTTEDSDKSTFLRNLVEWLTDDKDTRFEYISLCDFVNPDKSHYFHEGPLGEDRLDIRQEWANKVLKFFNEHMPTNR